jgi:hypothetical protein
MGVADGSAGVEAPVVGAAVRRGGRLYAARRTARRNVRLFTPASRFQLLAREAVLRLAVIRTEGEQVRVGRGGPAAPATIALAHGAPPRPARTPPSTAAFSPQATGTETTTAHYPPAGGRNLPGRDASH